MDEQRLKKLLRDYKAGRLRGDALVAELRAGPYSDLGFAKVDHHRALRCGFPEVIFCQGKTPAQVRAIATRILSKSGRLLATRATTEAAAAILDVAPRAVHHETARCVSVGVRPAKAGPFVVVAAAGTSDLPVAEEARVAAEAWGVRVRTVVDVGVAGLHRLLAHVKLLMDASALVVVAGMEGALPSVVAGLVRRPVVAVPTSVGYGANFKGVTPLLAMMNSCAAGVSVVNIDNGFGGGYIAGMVVASLRTRR